MRLIWIPNLLSLANLFFGFTSMLAALRGRFDLAAIFIFCSMILDMFDGRIARMIKHDNPLGKDLDSFADLVSFGIAPGVIFYAAFFAAGSGENRMVYDIFESFAKYDWVHLAIGSLAFVFPLCATLRLARFNVSDNTTVFDGLPSPVAGGTIVFLTAFDRVPGFFIDGGFLTPLNFALPYPLLITAFVLLALLMVTNITFKKPSKVLFNVRGFPKLWIGIAFNILAIAMLILFFKFFLLIVVVIYFASTIFQNLRAE